MQAYLAAWSGACLIAVILYLRDPGAYGISRPAYWRFLLRPWKIATFLVAATGLTVVAPYTRDPTWDYVDAGFMSLLSFTTAPWTVGVLASFRTHPAVGRRAAYVALCVALFSASWSYDLYLLARDGYYPVTWWANLLASSVLYLCAGLFWSLQRTPSGFRFALTEDQWRAESTAGSFAAVLWPALAFMALVGLMILWLVWRAWRP